LNGRFANWFCIAATLACADAIWVSCFRFRLAGKEVVFHPMKLLVQIQKKAILVGLCYCENLLNSWLQL
jgi:hypothetical protein